MTTTKTIRRNSPSAAPVMMEALEIRQLMTVIGGQDFPQGVSSFADSVIAFSPTQQASLTNPATVLGVPQGKPGSNTGLTKENAVSLGKGGSVTVGFRDNVLTNSGTTKADLYVFEIGSAREGTYVDVRPADSTTKALLAGKVGSDGFVRAGRLASGGTGGLDIDAAMLGYAAGKLRFDAVRVTDDGTNGYGGVSVPGADVDAIGAISSAPASVPTPTPAPLGKDFALKFDGVDDVAKANDSTSLNEIEQNQRLTVEAIVRVDGYHNGWFGIVDKTDASGFGWTFQIRQNEGIELTSVPTGTMRVNWNPVIGQTYHLAVTYDRQIATFYVNGKSVGSVRGTQALPDTHGPLVIGSNPSGAPEQAKGTIDELRLWSRVRSAAEIQANYLKPLGGTEANLVGYWRFNVGSGSTARDQARGNTLVLGSAAAQPTWVFSTRPIAGSISGSIFNDVNHDGVRQSSEPMLAGWQVYIDQNRNGNLDAGEVVTTTDAGGNYSFGNLSAGTYQIREFRQTGWTRSKPSGEWPLGMYDVTLASGQAVIGKDFANYRS